MSHNHNMDMSMTGMGGAMPTGTASGAMPSGTAMPKMDHGMMGGCKISMLWNWNTVDSCFISSSWRITSKGMFAGSCIGVILLVLSLELLRRAGKEYDRYILAQHTRASAALATDPSPGSSSSVNKNNSNAIACAVPVNSSFRPNVFQQAVRALLHMLQFAVAYFVMLLAMYYNGYIIICIFIGAFLGYFIFSWESFNVSKGGKDRLQEEVTVCCG